MPSLIVRADASWKMPPSVTAAAKRLVERKRIMEQSRMTSVRQIVRSEVDFVKHMFEEIVPVKISFDEQRLSRAWEEFVAAMPVKIEMKDDVDVLHHGMNTTKPEVEPLVDAQSEDD